MTIQRHYINMNTKRFVQNNETLCKEINGSPYDGKNTRSIPFQDEEGFKELIVGGENPTERRAINLFEKLTGFKIKKVEPTTAIS